MRTIRYLFIHCTAGSQRQTTAELLDVFRSRGWQHPGYHYVVGPDGEVEQLIAEAEVANGVAGLNACSIHIAYKGGTDARGNATDNRTAAQRLALRTLLYNLRHRYPDARILGHRDIWGQDPRCWKKLCPSFDAAQEYADI